MEVDLYLVGGKKRSASLLIIAEGCVRTQTYAVGLEKLS